MAGTDITAADLSRNFDALLPLIQEEWPGVDQDALTATSGALDDVIELVAKAAGSTKRLAKRHLGELNSILVADADNGEPTGVKAAATRAAQALRGPLDKAEDLIRQLESRTHRILETVPGQVKETAEDAVARAEETVRQRPLAAVFAALIGGILLGLLLGPRR